MRHLGRSESFLETAGRSAMTNKTLVRAARRTVVAAATAAMLATSLAPAFAQAVPPTNGPASVADLAEKLLGAVVNISTSQTVKGTEGPGAVPMPQLPEGSPFQDFFDEFFKDRGGESNPGAQKVQSLGSGFVIDAEEGIVVSNNHELADAYDNEVISSDGATLRATRVWTAAKTDNAVIKIDPSGHRLTAVSCGDYDKMRIGDWVMAIVKPFGLGGTVTVGIISANN